VAKLFVIFYGGRFTGPKTEAGKARQRAAVTKTGGVHQTSYGRPSAKYAGAGRVGGRLVRFKYDNHATESGSKAAGLFAAKDGRGMDHEYSSTYGVA
jgi:hypothetical protein